MVSIDEFDRLIGCQSPTVLAAVVSWSSLRVAFLEHVIEKTRVVLSCCRAHAEHAGAMGLPLDVVQRSSFPASSRDRGNRYQQ